jgi:hypothetical protein
MEEPVGEEGLHAEAGIALTSTADASGSDQQAAALDVTDPELQDVVEALQAARALPLPERVGALEAVQAALSQRLDAVDGT